jgi:hypothetical protein
MNVARRDVLRVLALLPGAALTAAGATACTGAPEEPPAPDPLADLASRARAVATAVPALAAAAGEVAAARGEHAAALQAEVDRERPPVSSSSAPPPDPASPPGDPAAARTLLVEALTSAQKEAADLVAAVPRYRAGLVGSVAASCASLREVLA